MNFLSNHSKGILMHLMPVLFPVPRSPFPTLP